MMTWGLGKIFQSVFFAVSVRNHGDFSQILHNGYGERGDGAFLLLPSFWILQSTRSSWRISIRQWSGSYHMVNQRYV